MRKRDKIVIFKRFVGATFYNWLEKYNGIIGIEMENEMLYLISGGSGSGKSEYAERLAVSRYETENRKGRLYYIATMFPYDEECFKKIERHQNMRKNKGFTTVECSVHLDQVMIEKQDIILVECMSNLLANEMYLEQGQLKGNREEVMCQIEEAILWPLYRLNEKADCVIVVTNEVFSDGIQYEEETDCYVKLLAKLNQKIAAMADAVVEVVCSIPIYRKGGCPC